MKFQFDFLTIVMALCVALGTVGFVQYVKGLLKSAPSWVWRVAMPCVALGLAAAFWYFPPFVVVWVLGVCLTELGWDALFQWLIDLIKRRPEPPAGDPK
jgi:type IV secretory pathway TrbL component